MKVAPKVIFLSKDVNGVGPAMANALQPNPNSAFKRTETSFELPLRRYKIENIKASGEIINFVDPQGLPQVSILLLQTYKPPVAACAVNEVLTSIMQENSPNLPMIILPFIAGAQKLNKKMAIVASTDRKVTLYAAGIGTATDLTRAMVAGLRRPPPSLSVHEELLACMLQSIRVLKLPAVFIVASSEQTGRTVGQELEALCELGEFLATCSTLCFSKDKIDRNPVERLRVAEEPWRALYG